MFFEEKEGATAVLQSLNALDQISVVRHQTESGRGSSERFEWFSCGLLGPERFRNCLNLIYGAHPLDLARSNICLFKRLTTQMLAALNIEGIPKISIDPKRFGPIVDKCVEIHKVKRC